MTDNEKLAKALGLKVLPKSPDGPLVEYDGEWHQFGNLSLLLASPKGEKAVRDRVRELCDNLGYDLRYGYLTMCDGTRQHFVLTGPPDKQADPYSIVAKKGSNNYADTEAEAWAAALLFLWEKSNESK